MTGMGPAPAGAGDGPDGGNEFPDTLQDAAEKKGL